MISAQKLKLIHVGRKELDLPEDAYREILRHHGGVESSKDLDDDGFKRVIDCMKALGFWVRRKFEQTRPRDPGDLPTPGQLKVIGHLWDDLGEYLEGAKHVSFQRGFYLERLKISALGPQTRTQANAVIESLKQRVSREMRKAVAGRNGAPRGGESRPSTHPPGPDQPARGGVDKEDGFRAAQAPHSGRTLTAIFAPQTRTKHPPEHPQKPLWITLRPACATKNISAIYEK